MLSFVSYKSSVKHIKIVVANGMFCLTGLKLFSSIPVSLVISHNGCYCKEKEFFVVPSIKYWYKRTLTYNSSYFDIQQQPSIKHH